MYEKPPPWFTVACRPAFSTQTDLLLQPSISNLTHHSKASLYIFFFCYPAPVFLCFVMSPGPVGSLLSASSGLMALLDIFWLEMGNNPNVFFHPAAQGLIGPQRRLVPCYSLKRASEERLKKLVLLNIYDGEPDAVWLLYVLNQWISLPHLVAESACSITRFRPSTQFFVIRSVSTYMTE